MFSLTDTLKRVREAKELSQKELAGSINMLLVQYSRIENGKTGSSFSVVVKINEAIGLSLLDFFRVDDISTDTNSNDKKLVDNFQLLYSLGDDEKKSIYTLIDSLISKKKLKNNLQNLVNS